MADKVVRVRLEGGGNAQHLASPPKDDVTRIWEGTTRCGQQGTLRWVTLENVDSAQACNACASPTDQPPLEGDAGGPV